MSRLYNFFPGPCGLPDSVMEQAQAEFLDYHGKGASIMEVSHRGDTFLAVYHHAESLLRELLGVSDEYAVLFLSGGASGQSAAIPLNLTADRNATAAYLITGHWSQRSATEGAKYCRVSVVADTADSNYTVLPTQWETPADAVYLHYADNETVHGVEFSTPPKSTAPLVADMSSNIASRQICVEDYGLIYAGAQKNLGPTGVTIVIVKKALMQPRPTTPMIWDYPKQITAESMVNTPPTFQIYMVGLVLAWLKAEGGVSEMEKRCAQKSQLLYSCIDNSGGFYRAFVSGDCRSRVNVPFFLADDALLGDFLAGAEQEGLIGLKGHAILGGCRASMYNSMAVAGVEKLTNYMRDFQHRRG